MVNHWVKAWGRYGATVVGAAVVSLLSTCLSPMLASVPPSLMTVSVRNQLSDLKQFPLFLSDDRPRLVSSSERLSPNNISQPSLVWIQDQLGARYGSDRLVEQWQAYQVSGSGGESLSYVDVIVSERIWNLLNYFERYAFIAQFGTTAKTYGYHLRVFHTGDVANFQDSVNVDRTEFVILRGAHFCGFDSQSLRSHAEILGNVPCTIVTDTLSGRSGRRQPVLDVLNAF